MKEEESSDLEAALRRMTDEQLVEEYREMKAETTGADPSLSPPERDSVSAVREEMDRRGLSPDREDVIPDSESPNRDPIVEDRA